MSWQVQWSDRAARQLEKIDRKHSRRIYDAVLECSHGDPHKATTRLVNSPYYRLRVGDYRVILELRQSVMVIFVVEANIRKKIYRK